MLVGRGAEQATIGALLGAARASRGGALVIRGEPGVGKTALLDDARAQAGDMRVLSARGVESESDLPFAGLHQLLRTELALLDLLPVPQAVALRGALGLAHRSGEDRFLTSVAVLTLLSEVARRRPVLCLVDDAHVLDAPSVDALHFAARRLEADAIAILVTTREPADARAEDGGPQARDLRSLPLRELDPASAAELLERHVSVPVARHVRDSLVEQCGGNPLALVELPAALSSAQLAGEQALPVRLPLTRAVETLYRERVQRLPDATRRLLLLVATDESGGLDTVLRAAEAQRLDVDALGAAERDGLVAIGHGTVRMRHPLLRSTVYHGASSTERRAAHAALAHAVAGVDADQRAWHRAASAVGPDAEIADELERAAHRARLRSGHASAIAGFARAAELSPDTDVRARRLAAAAEAAWHAGRPDRATALIDQAGALTSDLHTTTELRFLRGRIDFQCGALMAACDTLLAGAERIAPVDPRRPLDMLRDAANAGENAGDRARFAEALARASRLPGGRGAGDSVHRRLLTGVGALLDGRSDGALPLVRDALARTDEIDEPIWLLWAAFGAGAIGDRAAATALLRRATAVARASGAIDTLTRALLVTSVDGVFAGRFTVVTEATEGLRLAEDAGLRNTVVVLRAVLAWIAAVRGRDAHCREQVDLLSGPASDGGVALAGSIAAWALATLDLTAGRPVDAVTRLEAVRSGPPGTAHPYVALMSIPDLVEASVRTGRHGPARSAVEDLSAYAESGAPIGATALATRCRALLSGGDAAEQAFLDALRLHADEGRTFDEARTRLAFGEFLRRERRRRDAREQLRPALEAFERLGAEPWANRARAELRASGESARRRSPAPVDRLTPQELQISRLVADGLSNKEVAAQLFLSPRTIDYHLRSVFAKLDVTARTQLAPLLPGEPGVPAEVTVERRS